MLLAAEVWTYWMAFPLVVSGALLLLSFTAAYLKKVVEPDLQRRDELAAVTAARSLSPSAPPAGSDEQRGPGLRRA